MDKPVGPDLSCPESITRLIATVLRFRCPEISERNAKVVTFTKSFKTVGSHPITARALGQADSARSHLFYVLVSTKHDAAAQQKITDAAEAYVPLIYQVLLSCKVQPDSSRLDEKLVFEWKSGIEKNPTFFKSEALMYELVMSIATIALGSAGLGCDKVTIGEFKEASALFKKAATIMHYLATDLLPKWISRGFGVTADSIPAEANVGVCEAFSTLFVGMAQQLAVATVVVRPDASNYAVLSKLCLGISDKFTSFVRIIGTKASTYQAKIDPHFFTLMTFQIALQRGLSFYFNARSLWESKRNYGVAIAMLSDAISMLKTSASPTSKGLPDFPENSPLQAVVKDISDMRKHMSTILASWEKDNSIIYFEKVPLTAPENMKVKESICLIQLDEYKLEDVDPLPFDLPSPGKIAQEQSDRKLALSIQDDGLKETVKQETKDKELAEKLDKELNL